MACKNQFLEAERARKRESLLKAAEADLEKIAAACARTRRPLRGTDTIAVRVDRVLNCRKVAKHFVIDIGEDHLSYARDQDSIAAEAALDGIYVLRTSVAATDLGSSQIVLLQGPGQSSGLPRFNTFRSRLTERSGTSRAIPRRWPPGAGAGRRRVPAISSTRLMVSAR